MKYIYNYTWFTLSEILISTMISVMVLWGVFYFISEALFGFTRVSTQANFHISLYHVSSLLESWNFEIISTDGYHVWLIESIHTWEGIIVGVIDINTLQLIDHSDHILYLPAVIAYRHISEEELNDIRLNPDSVYDIQFHRDTVLDNFYIQSFEFTAYNSHSIHELRITFSPTYYKSQWWSEKVEIFIDDIHTYSFIF